MIAKDECAENDVSARRGKGSDGEQVMIMNGKHEYDEGEGDGDGAFASKADFYSHNDGGY